MTAAGPARHKPIVSSFTSRIQGFLKKKALYNRYYETFDEFREACETFFKNPHKSQRELRSLLTANFELTG